MSDIDPFENEMNLMWSVPVIWQIDGKGHYVHVANGLERSADVAGDILPGATFCVYRRQDEDMFRRFDRELEWGRFGLGLPTDLWERWTTGRDSGLNFFLCDVAEVRGFLGDAAREAALTVDEVLRSSDEENIHDERE